jgi:type II secretion system protein H
MRGSPSSSVRSGFTLMEIMIVVAIIGLVAAMGAPSLVRSMQKEGMRKAVSDVEDVFYTARERAVMSGHTVAATFYLQERRFEVEGGAGGGKNESGRVASGKLPDGIDFAMFDIYHQDFSQSEWTKIFFNADGTCDDGVVISLIGHGQKKFITLEFATGMPTASDEFR